MNKVFSSKEIAQVFYLIYEVDAYDESIESINHLDDTIGSLLVELEGRIIGDELLLNINVGSKIDLDMVRDDDESYNTLCGIIDAHDDVIFDETCKSLVEKRLKAHKTLYDAIKELRNSYKEA